jgi:hypothetical protein
MEPEFSLDKTWGWLIFPTKGGYTYPKDIRESDQGL